MSRILPSDTCKVYKKGCSIRYDHIKPAHDKVDSNILKMEDCPIYPIYNGLPNCVMVCDVLRQLVTALSFRDMSPIESHPPHLYECLWCLYFRTRNVITLLSPVHLCCLFVCFSQSVMNHHPYWPPITDWVYSTCMQWERSVGRMNIRSFIF